MTVGTEVITMGIRTIATGNKGGAIILRVQG